MLSTDHSSKTYPKSHRNNNFLNEYELTMPKMWLFVQYLCVFLLFNVTQKKNFVCWFVCFFFHTHRRSKNCVFYYIFSAELLDYFLFEIWSLYWMQLVSLWVFFILQMSIWLVLQFLLDSELLKFESDSVCACVEEAMEKTIHFWIDSNWSIVTIPPQKKRNAVETIRRSSNIFFSWPHYQIKPQFLFFNVYFHQKTNCAQF